MKELLSCARTSPFELDRLTEQVLQGEDLHETDAWRLLDACPSRLFEAANRVRQAFCGESFDFCTIVNGKSGACPEDCKFCAQSSHYGANCAPYPLQSPQELVKDAKIQASKGIDRYSIVTSGRGLEDSDCAILLEAYREIARIPHLSVCASHGLVRPEQLAFLQEAGVTRIHNNLEASEHFFKTLCTTHTQAHKRRTIEAAKALGLEICSGGIFGMGETWQDRIDLALSLRDLHVDSVPINFLCPIPGTPLEHQRPLDNKEACTIVALFRMLLPRAAIRLAGGRSLLQDQGRQAFLSGANAAITGDLLTSAGQSVAKDRLMIQALGFRVTDRVSP